MNYVGDYTAGDTVYIYFNTFDSNDPSASVTMTNFVNTDVHIHKNADLTQRNNAAGVVVDVDVDGITGCHLISIDTSDNTVADFFVSGADYGVRIEGVTVDAATLNPFVGHFSIENRHVAGSLVRTTIATLASQTSFTLTAGSADNDAYNNCTAVITDIASGVQKAVGIISDYVGATKTVTLAADPGIFTMAASDRIHIFATSALANIYSVGGTAQTANDNGADINAILVDTNAILVDTAEIGAAGAGLTAVPWNSNWDTEVESEVTDSLVAHNLDHLCKTVTAGSDMTTEVADNTILSRIIASGDTSLFDPTTDSLQDIRDKQTDIETDTQDLQTQIGTDGAGLTNLPWNATWDAEVESECNDALVEQKLDHLVAVADNDDAVNNSIVAKLASKAATADWSAFTNTTDSLEAIRDNQAGADVAAIADGVWDEATSGHTTAGTFGQQAKTDIDAILADTGTDGVVISTATAQTIADEILKRSYSNVEDDTVAHSIAALLSAVLESSLSGTTWTLKKTDGSTTMLTKTVTTDSAADPVTGVS